MRWSYDEYLKSEKWQRVRLFKIRKSGYKCQMCGETKEKLEVHHNDYKNVGSESENDLIVLCNSCHTWHHIDNGEKAAILTALNNRKLTEYEQPK